MRDLPDDPSDGAIVEAIIDLGHKLSIEIVAEGVETRRQLLFLRERGCDQVQGFLFSRPLPFTAAGEWLGRREAESDQGVMQTVRTSLRDTPTDAPT